MLAANPTSFCAVFVFLDLRLLRDLKEARNLRDSKIPEATLLCVVFVFQNCDLHRVRNLKKPK